MNKIKTMLLLEGIVLITFIIIIILLIFNIDLTCYIEKNYGILCPSCGGTRMVYYFLTGHIFKSFMMHPIFFIAGVYLFFLNTIFVINSFRKEKEICKWIYPKMAYLIIFVVFLLIFTIIRNIV